MTIPLKLILTSDLLRPILGNKLRALWRHQSKKEAM